MHDVIENYCLNQFSQSVVVIKIDQQVPDWELASHQHMQNQLMMTSKGLITVETNLGIWAVPAHHALWIPAHTWHKVSSYGISNGFVAFIATQYDSLSEYTCTLLQATTLLSALLERVEILPNTTLTEQNERLVMCLLDEIHSAQQPAFYLPMPDDPRLVKLVQDLLKYPERNQSLKVWATTCCMSERNLTRIFHQNTGMSINRWRYRLHVVLALQWLIEGDSVHQVAMKLAYDSDTSFILMFKKVMGTSPKKYILQFQ